MKACPHCGAQMYEEDILCRSCGRDMTNPKSIPAPANQPKIVRYLGDYMTEKEAKRLTRDRSQFYKGILILAVIFLVLAALLQFVR